LDGEKQFDISEAWCETQDGKKTQGLWVQLDTKNNIVPQSTLGKLLQYLEVKTLNDLKEKVITGYPDDKKGYLVATTYEKTA